MLCSARGGSWGMSRSKKQVALDALEAWNRVGLAGDGEERSTGYYSLYFHVSFLERC